ncbi:hypothetical protein CI109_105003 [Kwoniella shandongensis]|uniref:RING-type E3 ubiquitin transferase n=1 Tax=Kwoniella shandongensis TaxID=1734106 RepID=A0A5M6C261_9TREE|nr:uncharacterized protein CI109_004400 [Kwoniella shandongensis]KAA5527339.1 hypothetical protein CI109_004400 [Kwoniella shandongensis]
MSDPTPPTSGARGTGPDRGRDRDAPPQPQPPSSPRSPRPTPTTTPGLQPLPPGMLQSPPPRPNLSSMLFMTAFFFFMSGGNNIPTSGGVEIGPDGELRMKQSELDYVRGLRDDWKGWINGTEGNYTEPAIPPILPSSIIPPEYVHPVTHQHQFYKNITGFYRSAVVHPLSLSATGGEDSSPTTTSDYWRHLNLPTLNLNKTGEWNETLAKELRGSWDWESTNKWDMNLKERNISIVSFDNDSDSDTNGDKTRETGIEIEGYPDWTWVKGSATLYSTNDEQIAYDFYGLHHIPNGTYNLYALPEGMRVDIRRLPGMWGETLGIGGEVGNVTRGIVLRELEKEVKSQEDLLILNDVQSDDISDVTTCPLLIYMTLPPLPKGVSPFEIEAYERELQNPTGIRSGMRRPPGYWESGVGLGAVVVADGCGVVLGLEGGKGLGIDDFWRKSVNYAAFATVSQLLVLLLLVRQMESTRTPSSLAKVSLWSIVIMSISDSWIFSAHVVVGIWSDNKASLPMLVPGFLCLCTAVVFGPRYAVLLHRIQAPERVSAPPPPPPRPATQGPNATTTPNTPAQDTAIAERTGQGPTMSQDVRNLFRNYPALKWVFGLGALFFILQIIFLPSVIPFSMFALYSYWLPQIWRNARRGTSRGLDGEFVIGTTIGRLALPMYAFACPDNVFFVKTRSWAWGIVWWQLFQISVLYAQERLGPAFFLPKSLAPPELYNYHPLIPTSDPENPSPVNETTCSICMEEVDLTTSHPSHSSTAMGGLGDKRRNYALAPCGHLFHTKCLSQWMGIKTICPLCKRSLPPL